MENPPVIVLKCLLYTVFEKIGDYKAYLIIFLIIVVVIFMILFILL